MRKDPSGCNSSKFSASLEGQTQEGDVHPSRQDRTNLKPFVVVVSDLGIPRHREVPIRGRRPLMTVTPGQTFSYTPPPLPAFLMPEMPSYPVTAHQITSSIHHHHDYDYPGVTERKEGGLL